MSADQAVVPVADLTGGRCGTYAGYQVHTKERTEPCPPCRRANADYMRALRARNPELLNKESLYGAARSRALTRLAALHPGQYEILIAQELDR